MSRVVLCHGMAISVTEGHSARRKQRPSGLFILGLAEQSCIVVNYIKSIYFRKSVVKLPSVFSNHFRNLCFSITFN